MTYSVERDGQDWTVTAVNDNQLVDHTATFTGRNAQDRAERYGQLMEETDGELV